MPVAVKHAIAMQDPQSHIGYVLLLPLP